MQVSTEKQVHMHFVQKIIITYITNQSFNDDNQNIEKLYEIKLLAYPRCFGKVGVHNSRFFDKSVQKLFLIGINFPPIYVKKINRFDQVAFL